jgi:hypothetical protein
MHRGVRAGVLALAGWSACTPTTPGGLPDVRGSYGSPEMWNTEFTLPDGAVVFSPCGGSITIDRQDEGSLGGRFAVGCALVPAVHGQAVGEVDPAGNVTFDLRGEDAFQIFGDCEYVSGDRVWTGRIADDELTARLDAVLDCTTPGMPTLRVRSRSTASGELLPGTR